MFDIFRSKKSKPFSVLFLHKPLSGFQSFFLALLFAFFIHFFEETMFLHPQSYILTLVLDRGGVNLVTGLVTTMTSFFLLVGFFWISLRIDRRYRPVFAMIFAIPALVEFSYWKAFHRPFSVIDMQTAMMSPLQLWNAATGIFFNRLALIPITANLLFLFLPGKLPGPRRRFLLLGMVACIGINYVFSMNRLVTNWGVSLPRFYQTTLEWAVSGFQQIKREEVPFASGEKPTNNIILIIDESIRSDHLSLNDYQRPTTPYLELLAGSGNLLHNWGVAASGATCSPLSNALLITGVQISPQSTENPSILTQQYPTIFQYAYAAGYQTYYLDGQTDYLWNGLNAQDLKFVTGWLNTRQFGNDLEVDQRAAEWIHAQVIRSTGNFIVLNKKGVHFLYEDSYPKDQAIWEPIPTNYRTQPERVKNAYDNGIHYNVDSFFKKLLPNGEEDLENAIYLYTSDHGQTLFEGGIDWLHCNYTIQEASVPLLILGKLPHEVDTAYPAGHSNLFATLLDLMNIPDEARLHAYAPSLLRARAADRSDRYYYSGDGQKMNFDP